MWLPHIGPPALCTKAKVAEVGGGRGEVRICGTLGYAHAYAHVFDFMHVL